MLSNGEANKRKVLELALKVNEIVKPEDIEKIIMFFWLPENKPIMKEYEIFSLYGLLKNSSTHEDHSCLNKRSKFDHLIYISPVLN